MCRHHPIHFIAQLVSSLKTFLWHQFAYGCLAAAIALGLLALLVLATAPSAVADDGDPGSRVVAVTRPYWEASLPGYVRDLAVGDLNGDDQFEIVVGQEVESGGQLSVIDLGGHILLSLPFTTPVLAVALEDVDGDKCADLFVAQGANVLALNVPPELQVSGICKSAAGNQERIRWTRPLTLTSPQGIVSKLMMIDVDGDGTSEVVAVAGDVFALKVNDGTVLPDRWSFKNKDTGKPDAVKWLAVDYGAGSPPRIWFGTQSGAVYDRESQPVSGEFCDGDLLKSLDVGNWDDDTISEVIAGCQRAGQNQSYLEVRDLDSGLVLSFSKPSALVEPVIASEGQKSVFFLHAAGASILRSLSITPTQEAGFEEVSFFSDSLPADAVFTDLNGDGKNEVVIGALDNVRLFGYDKDRDSELGLTEVLSSLIPAQLSAPTFGKLNDDDSLDVVVGSGEGFVYSNRVGRQRTQEFVARGPVKAVQLVDFDKDGYTDVILAGSTAGIEAHSVVFGGRSWEALVIGTVSELSSADLDSDGKSEVLVGSKLSDSYLISAFSADGKVYWNPIPYTNTSKAYTALVAEDLAGDTWVDLMIVAGNHLYVTDATSGAGEEIYWQKQYTDPIRTVSLADLDGELPKEVVVGTEGMIHALRGESGELLWQTEIPGLRSIAIADVNGDNHPEVIAGSQDGSIYVLSSQHEPQKIPIPGQAEILSVVGVDLVSDNPGEELLIATSGKRLRLVQVTGEQDLVVSEFSLPGEITSMSPIDLEGEGREEVIITTNDGRVYFVGLTLNQPVLMLNPRYPDESRARVVEEYSVDVIDLEDELRVQLQVSNPGEAPWQSAKELSPTIKWEDYVQVGSVQHLEWQVVPFEEWDEGRTSRRSFTAFLPGDNIAAQLAPRDITAQLAPRDIAVQGSRQECRYLVGVVLGVGVISIVVFMLVRRRRRWAKSPAGEASRRYKRIEESPEKLLVEIGDLVAHNENALMILTELQVLCGRKRSTCATEMAEVVKGYELLLGGAKQWEAGLDSLQSGLSALPEVDGQTETLAVCKLLDVASTANSVSRIAALRSQIDAAQAMASVAIPGLPDLKGMLAPLAKIIDNLEAYEKAAISEEKVRQLSYALTALNQADREVRSALREPMCFILGDVIARWSGTVNNALLQLRGRAELRTTLQTRSALAAAVVNMAIELRNEGNAAARNVCVRLQPSEEYENLEDNGRIIALIPTLQSRSVEFRLRPAPIESFLARFDITYDDEQGTNRKLPFVDRVTLVSVKEEYKTVIPNPYSTGKPLEEGSTLFFGREEDFAFINRNLGAPNSDPALLLIGQRRTGKTSLLKQLPLRIDRRYLPVYVDMQYLTSDSGMPNFFYGLSQLIASSMLAAGIEVVLPQRSDFETAPSQTFKMRFLAHVEEALGDQRLLLAIDEFEVLEERVNQRYLEPAVYDILRHLVQHTHKLTFIFSGTHRLEELSGDYWSVLFNIALYRDIRFLENSDACRLISEPVAKYGLMYDDLAVKRILDITAGHPYYVQLICHDLVNTANEKRRTFITIDDVRGAEKKIISLGDQHFQWVWGERTRSAEERLVMSTLAALLDEGTEVEAMVTSSDIVNRLAEYRYSMDPAKASDVLGRLAAQDIVEEIRERTALQYRFRVGVYCLWIRENRPLNRVIEDVTMREPQRRVACPKCSTQFIPDPYREPQQTITPSTEAAT